MTPPPEDPNDRTYQHHYRRSNVSLAVIGERVMTLDKRLAEHIAQDDLFQERMLETQSEVDRTLKAIEISLAGWRGTVVAGVTAISTVWAVAIVIIQFLRG